MYFPRMHSARHTKAYEDWMGGVEKKDGVPTAAENLRFFLSYQVNFMYWRYFLWNFVGRQNNIQGHGEVEHGNWITGFRWIDDWLLGCDTSKLPSDLKENKGRNVFYALPLLLGLVGMLWQWRKGRERQRVGEPCSGIGKQQFLVVMLLFLMTGLAIVVYLNQTPLQPRERDYAYAGSFYAFAIWIGMGVGMISEKVRVKSTKYTSLMAVLSAIACLLVPIQMASQTWDDHDRSGRYTCRDFGANYLNSMQREGHPIILTNGDNDTFPLWYNHEVEGVRTDTRVVNMDDNIMHRFRYGGLSTKGIYVDEDVKRMANTHQLIMGVLIDSLLQRGDIKRALNVCNKWQKEMPQENVPYTEYALSMARCYYMAHQPEQGDEIVSSLLRRSDEWLSWINTIKSSRRAGSLYNRYTWMQTMEQALVVAEQFERTEFIHQYIKQYEYYNKQYQ